MWSICVDLMRCSHRERSFNYWKNFHQSLSKTGTIIFFGSKNNSDSRKISNMVSKRSYFLPNSSPFKFKNTLRYPEGNVRNYCTDGDDSLPPLTDFPKFSYPHPFYSIQNWFVILFIIRTSLDQEFNIIEFAATTKKVVQTISEKLANGPLEDLEGSMTPEIFDEVSRSLANYSPNQRQELAVKCDDMYLTFPYRINVINRNESRFIEITMVYHALKGFSDLPDPPDLKMDPQMLSELRRRSMIMNYRFVREVKGDHLGDWVINAINHFRPQGSFQMSFKV